MKQHPYFGKVEKSWSGILAEHQLNIPYFEKSVKIYLGEEFDEDGEEVETPPEQAKLDEYERTLKNFLTEIEKAIVDIQEKSFEYYWEIYAKYYEKPFKVLFENSQVQKSENGELHPPLNIDNKEKHFEYMKEIIGHIRVLDNNTLIIPISYALDEEHGLELKIANNKVVAVDGIAET